MTVGELKAALAGVPDDYEVHTVDDEYDHSAGLHVVALESRRELEIIA